MLALLALHAGGAVLAPACIRWLGVRGFYLLAAVPAVGFLWAMTRVPQLRRGTAVVETYAWVPELNLDIALRMGNLSWLLVVLVTGIGTLVLLYCGRYFGPDEPHLGRFAGHFVGFAGAMLGLVISDNLIMLYAFWELTTVFSFLLIGHQPESGVTRRAASQALIVTTLGGLAMLVGLIMIGELRSYRLSEVVADPPPASGFLAAALVLILVGALSKSAIFPFSFWLPGAMAAPTPVSAYLHAAAMVKAGVYLVAVLAPAFASVVPWRPVVSIAGITTLIIGGWAALRQTDLKLLLAYGTVSQLGLLTVAVGAGTGQAALAGAAMLLAHALFKATLFLVVGVVDHQAGTRDLRELSGLWRRMPWTFVVACLGAASMAGVPTMLGFVAKEAVFEAVAHGGLGDRLTLAGLVAGSALTVAYTARFLWGAFATKPDRPPATAAESGPIFLAAPALLAVAGLVLPFTLGPIDAMLVPYAQTAGPVETHLALWHGITPALGLSLLSLTVGGVLFASRRVIAQVVNAVRAPRDGAWTYERIMHGVNRSAIEVTGATQRGSLPFYLGTILVVFVVFLGGALVLGRTWENPGLVDHLVAWHNPAEVVVGGLTIAAAILAVRARRRLTAMLLVGLTGYGTASMFVLYGAPDLALTQVIVETVTIIVFVLVLRRLPTHFSTRLWRRTLWLRRGVGALVGLAIAMLAFAAIGSRSAPSISTQFPEAALSGGGRNVVNVTLVDIRAWDTLGEISVLVVAATGVASLIFVRPRTGPVLRRGAAPRVGGQRPPGRRSWLAGARALPPRQRSIILEVITRLLFYPLIVYSVYLLFSGHNAPGGGFTGGLLAGMGLAIRYLAGGRHELNEAAPVDAGLLLGSGLFLAVGTGITSMLLGGDFLQSAQIDLVLPVIGEVHLITSLFFDIGVYLIVIGLVLDILRSLGSEVDRQAAAAVDVHAQERA
ncbi:MAG TPA: Na+/H+ antiporter subunit A [Micromonosporaceae bacterium]|nr:Na+/H+ antiporter subunit A [Micromonosporaceae bacterium]